MHKSEGKACIFVLCLFCFNGSSTGAKWTKHDYNLTIWTMSHMISGTHLLTSTINVTTLVIWSQHVICPVGGSMRPLCCVCVIFSCPYVSLWGFWVSQNKGNSRIPETLDRHHWKQHCTFLQSLPHLCESLQVSVCVFV